MALGAIAVLTGFNSCNKDDEECCTISYRDGQYTYTWRACEDGTVVYTYTGPGTKETETYSWLNDYDTWNQVKGEFIDEGGTCN